VSSWRWAHWCSKHVEHLVGFLSFSCHNDARSDKHHMWKIISWVTVAVKVWKLTRRITSVYQPTNAHIISHKTLLKHLKTLRHVSILSDHNEGALFLAKVMLQYSQFNSYLQTRCCDSMSCCVGMCCADCFTTHSHIPTQHDTLPQHLVRKYELNCEYCNITLARKNAPRWWSDKIEAFRSVLKCFKSTLCEIICAFVGWRIEVILQKMHGATIRFTRRNFVWLCSYWTYDANINVSCDAWVTAI